MEPVRCHCKTCGSTIGDFANLWTQIGRNYFSPVVDLCANLNVSPQNMARAGEKHTLVEGCELQDIACTSCQTVVGLKCLRTPVNHVLDRNQILLRLTSITTLNPKDGRRADLGVKRILQLKGTAPETSSSASSLGSPSSSHGIPGRMHSGAWHGDNAGRPDAVDVSQLQADLEVHRGDIDRLDNAGYRIVSAFDTAVDRVEGEVNRLRDLIQKMGRDVRGNQEDLASLKVDLNEVKKATEDDYALARLEGRVASVIDTASTIRVDMTATSTQLSKDLAKLGSELLRTRQELADIRAIAVNNDLAVLKQTSEVEALRKEVSFLKNSMDQEQPEHFGATSLAFPSRELDILTSNVAKIGNKASQVDTLQMEFDILKGRIERMESSTFGSGLHGLAQPDLMRKPAVHADSIGLGTRKHHLAQAYDPSSRVQELPRGVADLATDTSGIGREQEIASSWTQAPAPITSSLTLGRSKKKPRLNKNGAVDGRSLRRTPRRKQ